MLLLQVAYNIILPIFLIVGLGVILERRFTINPRPLSSAAFYIFVSVLIVNDFAQSELQGDEIGLILLFEILLSLVMVGSIGGWPESLILIGQRRAS